MANPAKPTRAGKAIKRGAGKRTVEGASFRLTDEVRYVQRRAAAHYGRIVTIGQLLLCSTDAGDAWLIDRSDQLPHGSLEMARPNQSRSRRPIQHSRSVGRAATALSGRHSSTRQESGQIITILGYPIDKIAGSRCIRATGPDSDRSDETPAPVIRNRCRVARPACY
jgi:hypothetical protein